VLFGRQAFEINPKSYVVYPALVERGTTNALAAIPEFLQPLALSTASMASRKHSVHTISTGKSPMHFRSIAINGCLAALAHTNTAADRVDSEPRCGSALVGTTPYIS
jgi:hypothetical protein